MHPDGAQRGAGHRTEPWGGSYLEMHQTRRQRGAGGEGGDYRRYTLADYRRLQGEMRYSNVGSLGPDLGSEELRDKVGNHLLPLFLF